MSWSMILLYQGKSKLQKYKSITKAQIKVTPLQGYAWYWSLSRGLLAVKGVSAFSRDLERHPSSGDYCHEYSLQEAQRELTGAVIE